MAINWRNFIQASWGGLYVFLGGVILYNDKQTILTRPRNVRDAYSGYPDRELIDTLVGYGFILFGLTLIYRGCDRRALYHNRDLLLACMTLSLLSSIIFFDAGIEHRSFKDMHVERLSGKDAAVDVDTVEHTEKQ